MDTDKLAILRTITQTLMNRLRSCDICPRRCGIDRTAGQMGYCRALFKPRIFSYGPHRGEEPPISGTRGSGTIFFSHCNMKCVYCQNYSFSQHDEGEEISTEKLAEMMLRLERDGCHNINLVTPTHYVPQIVSALEHAISGGLSIPIVYNTSGYDSAEVLSLLNGIIDIYLPDMRYADEVKASTFSDAADYVDVNRRAIIEMNNQVGDLALDAEGVATKGIIIRLLVLPNEASNTRQTLAFIHDRVSSHAYLSIMSQYRPTHKAALYSEIARTLSVGEYANVIDAAQALGLNDGWVQEDPNSNDSGFLGTKIKPHTEV